MEESPFEVGFAILLVSAGGPKCHSPPIGLSRLRPGTVEDGGFGLDPSLPDPKMT